MDIDREKLIGDVARKLNILISKDDPVFACVLLNEIVLSSMIDMAVKQIKPSIDASQSSIGSASKNIEKTIIRASRMCDLLDQSIKSIWWQLGVIITVIIVLSICLSLAIQQYPLPFLSQQDRRHLEHGRMIDSNWSRLDKQTRDAIRSLATGQ